MPTDPAATEIAGRLLIGGYFLIMLWKNLTLYAWNVERMGANGVPLPQIVLPCGFVIQFVGAVMVTVGYRVDIGAVLLLVSPAGAFITGQILYVDGGRTLL